MKARSLQGLLVIGVLAVVAAALVVAAIPEKTYRAFEGTSYWNTPLDAQGPAPVDPQSAAYIADSQVPSHSQNYMELRDHTNPYSDPAYFAQATDTQYAINPSQYGPAVTIRIPDSARPSPGTDQAMIITSLSENKVVTLWRAERHASGERWTASGTGHYFLGSGGIEQSLVHGTTGNAGHRGLPGSTHAVLLDEVESGIIRHRLKCGWWATGVQDRDHYWPMSGDEGAKGGIVPEGIVIRIKPSVDLATRGLTPAALVVAKVLQDYGCLVGDNTGSGNALKLQRNADWTGILMPDSLQSIPWSDYEFVKGGYDPTDGLTH